MDIKKNLSKNFFQMLFYTLDSSQKGENSFLTLNIKGFIGHMYLPCKSFKLSKSS